MKFATYLCADISTGEITPEDQYLIAQGGAPFMVSSYPEGAFFYTASGDSTEDIRQGGVRLRVWEFSDLFVQIWTEASIQGIPYVRFDADAELIDRSPAAELAPASDPVPDTRDDMERLIGRRRVGRVNIPDS